MTPEESAVIEAARDWANGGGYEKDPAPLQAAVEALERAETAHRARSAEIAYDGPDPHEVTEQPWHRIVAGDAVLAKSGAWLTVVSTVELHNGVQVVLTNGDAKRTMTKPADETVQVRRGPDGRAADVWLAQFPGSSVISS